MLVSPVCHSEAAGGAERYLNLLYPRLAVQGFTAHLIGTVPGWPLPATPIAFGPKWSRRSTPRELAHVRAERRAVAAIADDLRPDLFHAQFKREQIGLTDVLARRAPVLWTEHGRFPGGRFGRGLAVAYRLAARRAAAIVAVSGSVAEEIGGIVGPRVRIEVVPNAIDTDTVRPATPAQRAAARSALGLSDDVRVVAWVGRMSEGKRPSLALETAARLPGVLLMAGSGPLQAEMHARAAGGPVRVLGHLADPSPVYQAADAFLFTSGGAGEGLPYSVLEAAAHDLPIVANAGAGLGDELSGAAATVVDDSPGALAEALQRASSDGASRRWAREHDLAPWAARHAQILRSL
ncbi:MAG TPA: glycosyltransferase family 4 protein [Solirubrobacteraceae bacterium]|nr:glycosyltransferase family 4 protein [Solirubrobacteraceae bacterium]